MGNRRGRGIWRCLYDPVADILITAGFDSAIKVHKLQLSYLKVLGSTRQNEVLTKFTERSQRTEVYSTHNPYASQQLDMMDSKSEYIRSLLFAKEDILYATTNNGFLYHIKLSISSSFKWTQIARITEEAPLICMDLLSNTSIDSVEAEDIIAIGDGKGIATVLRILGNVTGDCNPRVAFIFKWSAEVERQLLGVYWCRSLGYTHLFTVDPKGNLKVWGIENALSSQNGCSQSKPEVPLIALFSSSFGTRITCLDVSIQQEVLICGDQRGNLSMFRFSRTIAQGKKILSLSQFKGAHGISSVSSVSIGTLNSDEVEIRSTGGDGCICYFKFIKSSKSLEFIGLKQVKELSIIRSVVGSSSFSNDLAENKYAIGFTSTDFIVWNLMDEIKTVHISCGGWRRPNSFYCGEIPDTQSCFAFVKDNVIQIHRLWVSSNDTNSLSKVLHMQFHGREIHTLLFIPFGPHDLLVGTGCEDGTVRSTRCIKSDMYTWSSSRLLGEHVGGSAVRSLCFASKIYSNRNHKHPASEVSSNMISDQSLLISVGSKQVLTAWLLRKRRFDAEDTFTVSVNAEHKFIDSKELLSVDFQWLSTHMPSKHAVSHKVAGNMANPFQIENVSTSCPSRKVCEPKLAAVPNHENDWRYLAVTAFLVEAADCRSTVCFTVVACSDATMTMRAFLLPQRLWFDVAFLVPQSSPVLALQHVVSPLCHGHGDDSLHGNAYLIISGSTDGAITFWDVSKPVENFLQHIMEIEPEKLVDHQRRPRTGRGSQGGRWWKSSHCLTSQNRKLDNLEGLKADIGYSNQINDNGVNEAACPLAGVLGTAATGPIDASKTTSISNGTGNSILDAGIHEIQPLLVLDSVHQSGVNCLHVSKMENSHHLESDFLYCILSGGDDQSLHCTIFSLKQQKVDPVSINMSADVLVPTKECGWLRKCSYSTRYNQLNPKVLYKNRITSAHSSAVKGIWTDGKWVFSTGLDQRVRCWRIGACGELAELDQLIISVPEPETLDAVSFNRDRYQIAVAGRGMQMSVFIDTGKHDNCERQ